MYYVYLLYSAGHDKYYVGQTSDLETRLRFHNELSETSYTSKYRPWELRFSLEVADRKLAMQVESYIKGRKSKTYLEKLTNDEEVVLRLKKRFGLAG
jgi:putative endonuclease